MIRSSLRNKLLFAFLCVGVLPFTVMAIVSVTKAQKVLQQQAFSQMQSMRDVKKGQVTHYLQTIKDQALTFSEDHMIINAMFQFSICYDTFLIENALNKENIQEFRKKLANYYQKDFSDSYQQQNNGKIPEVDSIINKLDDKTVALQYYYIKNNPNPLGSKDKLDSAKDKSTYSQTHGLYHPAIRNYLKKFGYYDIFLVHPDTGTIIYSVFKELDFATSLKTGPYSNTNFADAYKKANASNSTETVIFTDLQQYFPSYEAPAGFVASPIFQGDEKIGILIFQFPLDNLNRIMQERSGMGKSSETYLIGDDMLMRSDSYLDPNNHSVIASFKNPEKGKVDTQASRNALKGNTNEQIVIDYNGIPVLSAYTPLRFENLNWALLAEIDEIEAFAAVKTLKFAAIIVAVIGIVCIILTALLFTRAIVKPVKRVVHTLTELSQGEGDLTTRLPIQTKDEIGQLASRFNEFIEKLQEMITDITQGVGTLSSSSTEMSSIAEYMSKISDQTYQKTNTVSAAAEEMTANMKTVAATMEQSSTNLGTVASGAQEMNSTINEIAQNAEKARDITLSAVSKANESTEKMNQLSSAAHSIGMVVETITDISEQVNLLSLNATIEAARAGESGKGFAVVANEIKDLAKQTSDASMDIKNKIDDIQISSEGALKSIEEISGVIADVNDIVSTIATAVEEQSSATNEIAQNISHASSGIEDVNANVNQSSTILDDMSKEISDLNMSSSEIAKKSNQVKQSAEGLSKLATRLDEMVGRFKI
ncbi:MAG: methyl-accepting chemotaxis protein [Desulfamplus sp.]|nr:methyl-accepting chemotaxis protein [Desulfamplus sp.]